MPYGTDQHLLAEVRSPALSNDGTFVNVLFRFQDSETFLPAGFDLTLGEKEARNCAQLLHDELGMRKAFEEPVSIEEINNLVISLASA